MLLNKMVPRNLCLPVGAAKSKNRPLFGTQPMDYIIHRAITYDTELNLGLELVHGLGSAFDHLAAPPGRQRYFGTKLQGRSPCMRFDLLATWKSVRLE